MADPFGTAPGPVALGTTDDSFFDFGFGVDLSSLASQSATLFMDVISEDDGFQFVLYPDNVRFTNDRSRVPEPTTLVLLAAVLLSVVGRNRTCPTQL